ncbi:hypothetical protein JCM11754A_33090 [Isoptericola variabilis]
MKGVRVRGDFGPKSLTGRCSRRDVGRVLHERGEGSAPMYEAPRITEVGSVRDVTLEQQFAFDYDGDLFHKGKAS